MNAQRGARAMALRDQLAELNAALRSERNAERLRRLRPQAEPTGSEPRADHWARIDMRERLRLIALVLGVKR